MVLALKNTKKSNNLTLSKKQSVNVIYISSYIPRKCGIATFTHDLTSSVNKLKVGNSAEVVAITDNGQSYEYHKDVKCQIRQFNKSDYEKAVEYINKSSANVVNLQHEFGLYRLLDKDEACCSSAIADDDTSNNQVNINLENGNYLLSMIKSINSPIITTFHTILSNPDSQQLYEMRKLIEYSYAVIAMTEASKQALIRVYNCPTDKVRVICHGVPDFQYNQTKKYQQRLGIKDANPMLLEAGLLGPGKGLEFAINAMPKILKSAPKAKLFIVGQTHPVIIRNDGELYRECLEALIKKLEIGKSVVFVNHYLAGDDLFDYFQAANFFVTPYLNMQQSASGTLAWALGAGKICVSTPFQYAREMLSDGAGILVRQKSSTAIANSIVGVFNDPLLAESIQKKAYARGHQYIWSNTASDYAKIFRECIK